MKSLKAFKCKNIIFLLCLVLCSLVPCNALDFSFGAFMNYDINLEENYRNTLGETVRFDLGLFAPRGRDSLYASVQGSRYVLQGNKIEPYSVWDGSLALGYDLRLMDRMSLALEAGTGIWYVQLDQNSKPPFARGLSFYGRAMAGFHVFPELTVNAFGGYKLFYNQPQILCSKIEAGIGFTYSITKGLFSKTAVKLVEDSVVTQNIFPVFYSRYDDHSFGSLTFVNQEPNDIQNVRVYIYMEKYMSNPAICGMYSAVSRGQSFDVELTAFLDEAMLNNIGPSTAEAKITLEYTSLGKNLVQEQVITLGVYGRNSMTWEDDRRAAAFVSKHDAAASFFAKQVKAYKKARLVSNVPENIQYAEAIFNVLKAYGMNYVVDPASAYVDNTGSSAVDFLQYPYQTLLYHGGDCDDLSILNCALLESIGIETAFITIPGHIYMAFDSGVPLSQKNTVANSIVMYDKVWVPVEITVCQDTFALARKIAISEWNRYPQERQFIPLKSAWEEYPAVGIPDSVIQIEMPDLRTIIN